MSAIGRFTWRSLGANKVRTAVTVAGVALAAALLCAVLTSYTSLSNYLYHSEEATTGPWMAQVQLPAGQEARAELEAARTDEDVTAVAVVKDAGFAALTEKQQSSFGTYLTILSADQEAQRLCAMTPVEGRFPQNAGEIMLSSTWKEYGSLAVGDEVTFQVGQREVIPGNADTARSPEEAGLVPQSDEEEDEGNFDPAFAPGALLDSSMGYLEDVTVNGQVMSERLVDTEPRTHTVSGFYQGYLYAASTGVGSCGITVDAPDAGIMETVYLSYRNVGDVAQVEELTERLFPDRSSNLHTAMLRYMGIHGDGAIWSTFYGLAGILAVVIVAACISLIYNAFAISVAERTVQFGLLASIGASRRQLRRAVLIEAGFVACAGIPAGILIGLAGCAATFAALGGSIAEVLGGADVPFVVYVEPAVLVAVALLTLATVLVSAFIPALRAGRVHPIDALRQNQKGRLGRRARTGARKASNPDRLWKKEGAASRLFGIGGSLARINRKRGSSKGFTASVSLALAILLLMTAGSLNTFLGTLVRVATPDSRCEVMAYAGLDGAEVNGKLGQEAAQAYDRLKAACDGDPLGWEVESGTPVIIPADLAAPLLKTPDAGLDSGLMADGTVGAFGWVSFIEDAAFDAYVQSQGLDPARYHDADELRALALGEAYGNNGEVYELIPLFTGTGTVEVVTDASLKGAPADEKIDGTKEAPSGTELGLTVQTAPDESGGEAGSARNDLVSIMAWDYDEDGDAEPYDLSSLQLSTVPVTIDHLISESPLAPKSTGVALFLPASAMDALPIATADPEFTACFDGGEAGHEVVAAALSENLKEAIQTFAVEDTFYSISDFQAEMNSATMLATIVNVFCLLFTIILTLIAMANVFNTITNSLILRRHEFAVMKSAGMSNRQFRAMITSECLSFTLRGIIPGFILSALVAWAMYTSVGESMTGLAFVIPWPYVALSVALTVAVLAIACAYGMKRCKTDSITDALRTDAI